MQRFMRQHFADLHWLHEHPGRYESWGKSQKNQPRTLCEDLCEDGTFPWCNHDPMNMYVKHWVSSHTAGASNWPWRATGPNHSLCGVKVGKYKRVLFSQPQSVNESHPDKIEEQLVCLSYRVSLTKSCIKGAICLKGKALQFTLVVDNDKTQHGVHVDTVTSSSTVLIKCSIGSFSTFTDAHPAWAPEKQSTTNCHISSSSCHATFHVFVMTIRFVVMIIGRFGITIISLRKTDTHRTPLFFLLFSHFLSHSSPWHALLTMRISQHVEWLRDTTTCTTISHHYGSAALLTTAVGYEGGVRVLESDSWTLVRKQHQQERQSTVASSTVKQNSRVQVDGWGLSQTATQRRS